MTRGDAGQDDDSRVAALLCQGSDTGEREAGGSPDKSGEVSSKSAEGVASGAELSSHAVPQEGQGVTGESEGEKVGALEGTDGPTENEPVLQMEVDDQSHMESGGVATDVDVDMALAGTADSYGDAGAHSAKGHEEPALMDEESGEVPDMGGRPPEPILALSEQACHFEFGSDPRFVAGLGSIYVFKATVTPSDINGQAGSMQEEAVVLCAVRSPAVLSVTDRRLEAQGEAQGEAPGGDVGGGGSPSSPSDLPPSSGVCASPGSFWCGLNRFGSGVPWRASAFF